MALYRIGKKPWGTGAAFTFCALFLLMLASSPMPASAAPTPPHTMTLQHVGEQDAALPRISFTTAPVAPPTAPRLLAVQVKPRTYQALCRILASSRAVTPPTSRTGSFEVHATRCEAASPTTWHIEPETFLQLIDLVQAQAQLPCAAMDSIQRIANIIRQANRMN